MKIGDLVRRRYSYPHTYSMEYHIGMIVEKRTDIDLNLNFFIVYWQGKAFTLVSEIELEVVNEI